MRRCERSKIDRLDFLEPAIRIHQAYSIPGDKTAQRVTEHAQLLNLRPTLLETCDMLLDLLSDPLSASLDAIISIIARVARRNEDVQLILRKLVSQRGRDIGEMVRIAP